MRARLRSPTSLSSITREAANEQGWEARLAGASELTRRSILQIGGLGFLGLNARSLLQAEEKGLSHAPRARSVIFLFQFGGPSHLDTFDMKPDAPDGV
ncbi:MAG TPA: DUF1501 domain-containing protein, partial [Planctomycetota bacterium]|nr:DUF1501 domain-containing protein [Planctomycetota bacterium]